MANENTQYHPSDEEQKRAWLATLLLQRQGQVMPRFALALARLRALSRGQRRRLQRRAAATVAGAALVLAIGAANFGPIGARPAYAATIAVANGEIAVNDNNVCSLIEAIINAENGAQTHDDCAAGSGGADTIDLPAGGTFNFTAAYVYDQGNNGLPTITTEIIIAGDGSTLDLGGETTNIRLARISGSGDLTLNDTIVSNGNMGDATFGGGVFRVDGGDLTLDGSSLTDNATNARGGAIFALNSATLTLTDSSLARNSAFFGGAIASDNGDITLTDSDITGNTAERGGGGVFVENGSLTVTGGSISDNGWELGYVGVNGYTEYAGGVFVDRATVSITGTTIDGNYAGYGGGVWVQGTNEVTISQSAITNNVVGGGGGGVRWGASPDGIPRPANGTITNTTISGNIASDGGGAFVSLGEMTLNNVTVSDNVAMYNGGGLFVADRLTLNRTLISGNAVAQGDGAEVYNYDGYYGLGVTTANNFNLFGHSSLNNAQAFENFTPGATDITATSDGTQPTALASILAPLADNGGPTTPATETHALVAGSPALDRGPNAACTAAPVDGVDQRDVARNQNGSGAASGNECDVGAYEYVAQPTVGVCPAPGNELTTILGVGMGSTKKVKKVAKITIPNSANLVELYGQLVGKQQGPATNHVRFFYPNGSYEQVNMVTSPAPQQAGIFWYGAPLDPASSIRGKWFLRPGKAKSPRALLLYATHQTTDTYFNTYVLFDDGATNQVAGGPTWPKVQELAIPIDDPTGPADITVQVALVDNDQDNRAITVRASAGAASDSDTSTGPTHGPTLSIITLNLNDVGGETGEVVITLETTEQGDSAAVVGAAVNYACEN